MNAETPAGVSPLLTIFVPTIPGRESLLSRCLFSITEQAADSIEVLVVEGAGALGDKVNAAAVQASGDYFTVVDDDDWLAACYCAEVLPLCAESPDYVGLKVLELDDGRFSGVAMTSGASKRWDGSVRLPVPKGVTRTSIVRRVAFGNHYTADRDWSAGVAELVTSWRFVDRCLYVYDYRPEASAFAGSGSTRHVGWWPFNESMVRRLVVDR